MEPMSHRAEPPAASPPIPDDVAAFTALHRANDPLVLANAWDAASAAIARAAGAAAIATTSAGVAWTCGYPDGGALPRDDHFAVVRAIKRMAGPLPVSVDLEAGYADDPERVAALVCEVRALGVAGINIEDGSDAPELLARKIEAIKRALHGAGDDLFINARTDVYLRHLAGGRDAVREVGERARRYAAAGADGLFVPAVVEPEAIAAIAAATDLPLNVLLAADLPAIPQLRRLGVRRLSAGSAIASHAFGAARAAAERLLSGAAHAPDPTATPATYAEMNALVRPSSEA